MQYPTITLSQKYSPFAIYFIYPRFGKPFIIKGMANDCVDFIDRYHHPCFYRYTYWRNGKSRGAWVSNKHIYFRKSKGNGYDISVYDKNGKKVKKHFRRIPRSWIESIEQLYLTSMER